MERERHGVKLAQEAREQNHPCTNSKEGAPRAIHFLLIINFKA